MNLIVGHTYTAVPIFIANLERRAALTRHVRIVRIQSAEEGTPLVAMEYLNDGPYNEIKKGPLWRHGNSGWHDSDKWSFEPL